jgi:hypothetical protein
LAEIYNYWLKIKWFIKLDMNSNLNKNQQSTLLNECFKITKNYKLN